MKTLSSHKITPKSNWFLLKVYEKIFSLLQHNKLIYFIWTTLHSGIQGNEKVDKLAKSATIIEVKEINILTYTDALAAVKSSLL